MTEELTNKIKTEEEAELFIRSAKENRGITCKRCGSGKYYFDSYNKRWVCKECKKQQSLVSETVMHGTQLSALYWLKVIYCFAVEQSTTRVKLIQDEVEPDADIHRVWEMLQKIRSLVSKYVDENKKLFRTKKYNVTADNRDPKFSKFYNDELKYKIKIQPKDDWEKFTDLLDICLSSKPPFKHQSYGRKEKINQGAE